MSGKFFCPNCGAAVAEDDKFCQNCGANIRGEKIPPKQAAPSKQYGTQSGPVSPTYQQQGPYQQYQPGRVVPQQRADPSQYHLIKADLGSRCGALLIDGLIWSVISACTGGLGSIAYCFKDSIPEAGQSFGKRTLNIRVVDYDTGRPMDAGQGCVRTCTLAVCSLDIFVPLCTEDGRRLGDYIAGTIVIEDR